jgi:hypothetical protein
MENGNEEHCIMDKHTDKHEEGHLNVKEETLQARGA